MHHKIVYCSSAKKKKKEYIFFFLIFTGHRQVHNYGRLGFFQMMFLIFKTVEEQFFTEAGIFLVFIELHLVFLQGDNSPPLSLHALTTLDPGQYF
jgi:hypothetical protein